MVKHSGILHKQELLTNQIQNFLGIICNNTYVTTTQNSIISKVIYINKLKSIRNYFLIQPFVSNNKNTFKIIC